MTDQAREISPFAFLDGKTSGNFTDFAPHVTDVSNLPDVEPDPIALEVIAEEGLDEVPDDLELVQAVREGLAADAALLRAVQEAKDDEPAAESEGKPKAGKVPPA